jgi:hypothetical protein
MAPMACTTSHSQARGSRCIHQLGATVHALQDVGIAQGRRLYEIYRETQEPLEVGLQREIRLQAPLSILRDESS